MGLSEHPLHSELEEIMNSHIYACLSRPMDEEELAWMRRVGDHIYARSRSSKLRDGR